ncbi:N-6 DNA methylase [Patescibacteria group bacterium]|nr:N-6 DNA methylase [Patescibacteria group bacterium]
MSEELQSKYLKKGKITGQKIGDFEYFQIGASTFNQLKQAKIIPSSYNKKYDSKKPDRLIVDRRNKTKPVVMAVIEDKQGGKFTSDKEKQKAIQQCNNYCHELKAKMGIITDGATTIWINPSQKNNDNEYIDKTTNEKRSFSFIKKEDGTEIVKNFIIKEKDDIVDIKKVSDDTKILYKLIREITQNTSSKNSIIKQPDKIDPLPLARRVWQDIWVATGKSPEKCLYNVVELFIFKFLSDLKVLEEPENFEYLLKLTDSRDNKYILGHYAKVCRPKIKELFPPSREDGTTIINGTIFVNEDGEPNLGQSTLFCNSLKKFKDFEKEQGTFEHIDREFKTKLFETFLKQSEGQKALGQYFTPRKVVQAVVNISGIENLKQGARFCDPFCGVGGFVLEPINLYRLSDFQPKNDLVDPPISYFGFDKGFEKDEERTIILAKANMLLYLTEIISKNPNLTKKFAEIFNKVFRLWQSNLGTLEHIFEKEEEKFDLILTNPPYVTSGSATLKNEILESADLKKFYSINAGGIEGLGLEWIIRSLKKGGKAFVVIPDGLLNRLNDKKMRKFILDECYLEGIISLPIKTFFSTPKKTYILAITKKEDCEDKQNFPVFTYIVSNVGETLDVNRFEIPENDLNEAVDLFNQFQGIKKSPNVQKVLESQSKRCKIQNLDKFEPEKHWSVDRWWSKEEKIELGIEEEEQEIKEEEFFDLIYDIGDELKDIFKKHSEILKKKSKKQSEITFKTISLDDKSYFNLSIGKRLLKKDLFKNRDSQKANISAYSANVFVPFGYVEKSNISNFVNPYILWGIDGNFDLTFKDKGEVFASTDHCGTIEVLDKNINPEYLLIALYLKKIEYGFDRGLRSNLVNVRKVEINIPIDKSGNFDTELQKKLVESNQKIKNIQNTIIELKEKIESANVSFDEDFRSKEVVLNKIIDFSKNTNSSKFTKAFIDQRKGNIPVYSASDNPDFVNYGHVQDNLPNVKYFEDCMTWNIDGSVGKVFIRNGKFSLSEKVIPLVLFSEYEIKLDKIFLKYEIEKKAKKQEFGFTNKAGKSRLKNIIIQIPIDMEGNFEIEKQKEIAQKYEKVEELKKELTEKLDILTNYKISLE